MQEAVGRVRQEREGRDLLPGCVKWFDFESFPQLVFGCIIADVCDSTRNSKHMLSFNINVTQNLHRLS